MIKIFCLINGRDVIATIKEETENAYHVENALTAVMMQQDDGQVGVHLVPISPLTNPEQSGMPLTILKQALAFEPVDPNSKAVDHYSSLRSPIVVPNNGIVSGFTRN